MAERIVVVDDDPSVLELLHVLLENEGYTVETFQSAPLALKATVRHRPDAVIVDLMMPEMSGLDFLKALRYNRSTRDVPALVCSAYYEDLLRTDPELRRQGVSRLRKPFHVNELLDVVAGMVKPEPRRLGRRRPPAASGGMDKISAAAA